MTIATPPTEVHTERSMKQLLHRALLPENRPASGILATGIESPDGRRKADGIWAGYQRGAGLIGYEIKVSRSDLLSELADPMKTEPWLQYCTHWYLFVSDPAMVDGLDIPERWGILAPPSGRRTRSLTYIRNAPTLHPIDTSAAWQRVVSWYAVRNADRAAAHEREVSDLTRRLDRARQQALDSQHGSSPNARHMGRLYQRVVQALQARGVHGYGPSIDDEQDPIGDALVSAAADLLLAERYTIERVRAAKNLVASLETALSGLRDGWHSEGLKARIAELLDQHPPGATADTETARATA